MSTMDDIGKHIPPGEWACSFNDDVKVWSEIAVRLAVLHATQAIEAQLKEVTEERDRLRASISGVYRDPMTGEIRERIKDQMAGKG